MKNLASIILFLFPLYSLAYSGIHSIIEKETRGWFLFLPFLLLCAILAVIYNQSNSKSNIKTILFIIYSVLIILVAYVFFEIDAISDTTIAVCSGSIIFGILIGWFQMSKITKQDTISVDLKVAIVFLKVISAIFVLIHGFNLLLL